MATASMTWVGVSQNGKKDTLAFLKEYGVTFPVLLDDPDSFAVSNAYGLTNVPTIFWIAQDGTIAHRKRRLVAPGHRRDQPQGGCGCRG